LARCSYHIAFADQTISLAKHEEEGKGVGNFNFNFQHELLNLHKHLIEIDRTLGSFDSKWAEFKEAGTWQPEGGGVDYDPYQKIIYFDKMEGTMVGGAK
jgi:hypothetical protein